MIEILQLQMIALEVLERAFELLPYYFVGDVRCHKLSNKQFRSRGLHFTLKQWALLAEGIQLKKYRHLTSKSNLNESIDTTDLYFKNLDQ